MAERLEDIEPRILFLSLTTIIILAIIRHLSTEVTLSILTIFLIVIIALGNIGYLYNRFKKT